MESNIKLFRLPCQGVAGYPGEKGDSGADGRDGIPGPPGHKGVPGEKVSYTFAFETILFIYKKSIFY